MWDEETELHYNYFRDYDPRSGRYVQSDPIGLQGGLNIYVYTSANPLIYKDPVALSKVPALLNHYIYGDGETHHVAIQNIDTSHIRPSMFSGVQQHIPEGDSCCEPRTIKILTKDAFSLNGDDWAAFGTVRFQLWGELEIDSDCSWCFRGRTSILGEMYDFDTARRHRKWYGQAATWIGSLLPGTPFWVDFVGSKAMSECGR